MAQKLQWRTETRKVSVLVPNPKNPRVMSPKQMEDLKKSLRKFDIVELPVIDADDKIIAGHQRLLALQLLGRGEEEIPVRVPSRKLTKQEYEQYLLSSNRIHGDWDYGVLGQYFDLDTMLASGFDDNDLSVIFADALEVSDDEFDVEAELAKSVEPKSKLGDLYALGPHRLLVGDALDSAAVKRLVGKTQIDMIYCDPPYNISLDYDKGVSGKAHYGGVVDDTQSDEEYRAFLHTSMENALAVTKPDCHTFYWADQKYIGMVQGLFAELGLQNRRVCLWIKGAANPTPNVAFNKCYEPCVYATRGGPYIFPVGLNFAEVLNKELGPSGNKLMDDIKDSMDIWLAKRVAGVEYEHPTQKPLTLHERPLKRCTRPGGTVLDLFGGSGSTLLACDALKRVCFTLEFNLIFADLIIKRYEQATGIKAKKLN
ncbi:MAG: DNA modification methylase [Minisyncoccia bacterium]|jgi:DNA modification methylase